MSRERGTGTAASWRRAVLACFLVLIAWASPGWAEPAAESSDGHELWIISTRCVSHGGCQDIQPAEFDYQRFDRDSGWTTMKDAAFFDSGSAGVPTSFYVHGNRVDPCDAVAEGQCVYQLLDEAAGNRPFRFVIWSWPATRIGGRVRDDVRIKAARSDVQAYYLASVVRRMSPEVPVAMLGHSFGARAITGALHLLAGGQVAGRELGPRPEGPGRAVRVMLVAAALDNGWLLPGRRNGLALQEVDQMLITQNCNDRVLRLYPRMYGRRGPEALGFTGPACPSRLGDERSKLEVLGVSCSVGRGHGWHEYLCSWPVRGRLAWYARVAPAEAGDADNAAGVPEPSPTELPLQPGSENVF
ncbi:MAG: hypothetical protein JW719_08270 [Pirellulales bacterium]|nr:hypothetical protein [Pirellulales bacterium]